MQNVSQQMQEALSTGGIGARLPIVQRGIEATNAATSQALTSAREDFARAGMGPGDPFALETLANLELAGALESAGIPLAAAQQFIDLAPNFALGGTTPIVTSQQRSAGKSGGGGVISGGKSGGSSS